jgi:3-hydroxybutyrate dehydrogenase
MPQSFPLTPQPLSISPKVNTTKQDCPTNLPLSLHQIMRNGCTMTAPRYDFTGKTVLVTGASRGIGYGVAEGFVGAGASVFVLAESDRIVEAARKLGPTVTPLQCDITDRDAVRRALAPLERIDVLVNNAGLERITPVEDPDPETETTFRRIIDINVNGTWWMTREAVSRIPDGGRIIITASIWSRTAEAGFAAYVASKHASIGLMKTLAKELAPRAISVNAVCPGWVKTDAAMLSLKRMSERTGTPEPELLDSIIAAQQLPGLMTPPDMADMYLFLASKAARNITGQSFTVDRGEVIA